MRNLIFIDGDSHSHLLPLTHTRPVADLRVGILTIREKWERRLNGQSSFVTAPSLQALFPLQLETDNFLISGGLLPHQNLVQLVASLRTNQMLLRNGTMLAARLDANAVTQLLSDGPLADLEVIELPDTMLFNIVDRPWHIFKYNGQELERDFDLLTHGRTSAPISMSNRVAGAERIFLEAGAKIENAILNATSGPIYLGQNSEIMEGVMVRGGLALCENAQLKMGAKIYGPTTIGPGCKVGGEITNSVFWGNSNKAHDGYVGNSVIGEWCNLGADTNTSNLKNNYDQVRLWSMVSRKFEPTGEQFLGLIMGDHSKCGINTMFNTGTVVGVSANIFGDGYPRNFIPSFSWGGASGFTTYQLLKAVETMNRVLARRNSQLSEDQMALLAQIFDFTASDRVWEKTNSTQT